MLNRFNVFLLLVLSRLMKRNYLYIKNTNDRMEKPANNNASQPARSGVSANSIIRASEISECCNKKSVRLRASRAADEERQVMLPCALYITLFRPT